MVVWHIGHRAHSLSSVCLRPKWVVWHIGHGNSYICKVFEKLYWYEKKNLAKKFTSEKYYFITDNINVTLLINGQNLAKSRTTFPPDKFVSI